MSLRKKAKRKCRFCERTIEKGHRCYELDKPTRGRNVKEVEGGMGLETVAGERELAINLFNSRGGRSEISGKPLLPIEHEFWHWQFLHVLPKGNYKRYRLNPKNIVLALPEEHDYQNLATKDPKWAWFFLLKSFLQKEYIDGMDNRRFKKVKLG